MQIDFMGKYLPGTSFLHRWDPRLKFLGFINLLLLLLWAHNPSSYGFALLCLGACLLASGVRLKYFFAGFAQLRYFLIFIFLLNTCFFSSEEAYFSWWIFTPSPAGLRQGLLLVLNVVLIVLLTNLLSISTKPTDLVFALERLLSPLTYIGVPSAEIAMILSLALQFIPILISEIENIKQAQIARGARFDSKKLRERAQSYLPLIIPVFVAAFRRADEMATAMEARGYRNARERSQRPRPRPRVVDYLYYLVSLALLLAQICIFA